MSGKMRFDPETFDPKTAALAAIENGQSAALTREVALDVRFDQAGGEFVWDSARFQQVVWNLVDNAVKFTPRGGRVEIVLTRRGTHLTLTVRDNGRGISSEFLPHVFDRFRQQDSGTRRWHGGLGLGLAIVKHMVESQGGTVTVRSAGENQGATFEVVFVSSSMANVHGSGRFPLGRTGASALAGIRVLVVEDDPDARAVVGRMLRDAHADVCDVASVGSALEALDHFIPHVIVSDIGMPAVDGYDLIRLIREHRGPTEGIPAIALTAFVRESDRQRALDAGFALHLPKPVNATRLIAAVAQVVGDRADGAGRAERRS